MSWRCVIQTGNHNLIHSMYYKEAPMSDGKTSANSFLSGLKEESNTTAPSTFSKPISNDKPVQSTIGNGISFRGELIGTEDLHIEGKVEGTVIMAGQNLTIGEEILVFTAI